MPRTEIIATGRYVPERVVTNRDLEQWMDTSDEWIRQLGDPVLRQVAAPVAEVDDVLRMQLRRMMERLRAADGAGLAATQVGFLRRAFVFRQTREDDATALVNPRGVSASEETAVFFEGCLSFPGAQVEVERPRAVVVEAMGLDGEAVVLEAEDGFASLLQHELDHLDGVLIIDRTDDEHRKEALGTLRPQTVLR